MQGDLQDVCVIHACVSIVSIVLALGLTVGIFRKSRLLLLVWFGWSGIRVAFYVLYPIYMGIAATSGADGVPRIRGSDGTFLFFVMPFVLAGGFTFYSIPFRQVSVIKLEPYFPNS